MQENKFKALTSSIDKVNVKYYNTFSMLSRVDERIGSMTPQQPVKNKVLIPTKQDALADDFINRIVKYRPLAFELKVF